MGTPESKLEFPGTEIRISVRRMYQSVTKGRNDGLEYCGKYGKWLDSGYFLKVESSP